MTGQISNRNSQGKGASLECSLIPAGVWWRLWSRESWRRQTCSPLWEASWPPCCPSLPPPCSNWPSSCPPRRSSFGGWRKQPFTNRLLSMSRWGLESNIYLFDSQAADIVLDGGHDLEDYWEGAGGYSRQDDYVEEDYKDYAYGGNHYPGDNWKQG